MTAAAAKQPPLANEAGERVVLGKILQSADAYWRVCEVLQPMHFSRKIHNEIYTAIRDLLSTGSTHSLGLVEARVGPEYEDGKATAVYLSALLRDAEEDSEGGALELVDDIVDLWRRRATIQMLEMGLQEVRSPSKTSFDVLAELERRALDINLNSQAVPLKRLASIAAEAMASSAATRDSGMVAGFDTGLPSMDELIGRVHLGDVGVIGAKSGDGKTVLGAQIAMHIGRSAPVMFFQLEMKDQDMARRALAGLSTATVGDIEAGTFDFEQHEQLQRALELLKGTDVYIDDRARLHIEQMYDRALMMKRRFGRLGAFVVDHVRHVRTYAKIRDRFERIEHVTGEFKAMAKELDTVAILLSQVTRASQRRDDPRPQLNDLDGGGSLEQDMDWGVTLFRRDRWLKQNRPSDQDSPEFRKWSEQWVKHKGLIEMTSIKGRRREDGETRSLRFDGRAGLVKEVGDDR